MDDSLEFEDVFRALSKWSRTTPRGARAGGGGPRGFDHIQLHARPDPQGPEVQLTFKARFVEGRPVIVVSCSPKPEARRSLPDGTPVVLSTIEDRSPGKRGRDPAAVCEACGRLGTVGFAARTDGSGAVTEMHRFCADCWPEQSARYRARWEEERRRQRDAFLRGRAPAAGAEPGMTFHAATWHGILELVREIERTMVAPLPPIAEDLARLAAQIREQAPEFEDEMPLEVETFLRRYGTAAL
jgi:hypothetical protein